ncbi:RNA ligase-domain-containing protein [Hypoxylon rubiginosum]|uniref:RNA ligase-domain-containing protein n=1 Tax=Hypoxylon rubiginosum TaxID=110542 RepID=A0ACB9Z2R4_9PEZI|nr:RNA ligase-domain-containing protein [Hypoxylon rubiginosum]
MMNSTGRRLVTVRRISEVDPILGSPCDVVTVDGWKIVVMRQECFYPGQLVVYFEIDSFLPNSSYFWEYCAASDMELDNEPGYLVTTNLIHKNLSQGLIFHPWKFAEVMAEYSRLVAIYPEDVAQEELMKMSFHDVLGVKKWEDKATGDDSTGSLGLPPIFFPQPGCDRAQNIPHLFADRGEQTYQITEKLDGVPMTVYLVEKSSQWFPALPPLPDHIQQTGSTRLGVCSRQQDIIESSTSCYWNAAKQQRILDKIGEIGKNIAVQGELCGSTILGNSMGFGPGEHKFYVFDIYDIDNQQRMQPSQVASICSRLGWDHAPIISNGMKLSAFARDVDDLLAKAEGIGLTGQMREGLVFKTIDAKFAFKAISNSWLLTTGKEVNERPTYAIGFTGEIINSCW